MATHEICVEAGQETAMYLQYMSECKGDISGQKTGKVRGQRKNF